MFGYRDFRGDDRLLSIYKGIIYTDIKQVLLADIHKFYPKEGKRIE